MGTIFRDPVTVNDFSFNGGASVDGATFYCDTMDGWLDTAAPRVEVSSFGYSDGVIAASRFPLSEKYIEFGGYVLSSSRLAAEKAADKLSLLFDVNTDLVVIRNSAIPKAMDMRVSGDFQIPQDLAEQGFRWIVRLMAEWPFKYSPEEQIQTGGVFSGTDFHREYDVALYGRTYDALTFGRSYIIDAVSVSGLGAGLLLPDLITITNDGTADAYPEITVTGPLLAGSWELINETTGEVQSFDIDLSTGVELIMSNRDKTAYISGQAVDYYLRGDWIHLVPGPNRLRLSTGDENPDASFKVVAHNTWKR